MSDTGKSGVDVLNGSMPSPSMKVKVTSAETEMPVPAMKAKARTGAKAHKQMPSPAMKARTGTSRNSVREMPLPAMEPRTTVQPSDAAVVRTDVPLPKKPARVLHQPGATLLERLAIGSVKVGFDFPTTLQGSTAHFN